MAPAISSIRSVRALVRLLAVVLVSIATPASLAAAPESPVSRKLDTAVRGVRVGPQRLDVSDSARHEIGDGPDVVDGTAISCPLTTGGLARLAPPGPLAIVSPFLSLEPLARAHRLPRISPVPLLSLRGYLPSPGRAPPSA